MIKTYKWPVKWLSCDGWDDITIHLHPRYFRLWINRAEFKLERNQALFDLTIGLIGGTMFRGRIGIAAHTERDGRRIIKC